MPTAWTEVVVTGMNPKKCVFSPKHNALILYFINSVVDFTPKTCLFSLSFIVVDVLSSICTIINFFSLLSRQESLLLSTDNAFFNYLCSLPIKRLEVSGWIIVGSSGGMSGAFSSWHLLKPILNWLMLLILLRVSFASTDPDVEGMVISNYYLFLSKIYFWL